MVSSEVLSSNTSHCTCRCDLVLFTFPVRIGALRMGTRNHQYSGHCYAVLKVLVSHSGLSRVLPASMTMWQASLLNCKRAKAPAFHSFWHQLIKTPYVKLLAKFMEGMLLSVCKAPFLCKLPWKSTLCACPQELQGSDICTHPSSSFQGHRKKVTSIFFNR